MPPAPHDTQAARVVAPIALLKYPTAHVAQVDVAVTLLKVPAGHGEHNADAPVTGLKVPAGHCAHVDRPELLA